MTPCRWGSESFLSKTSCSKEQGSKRIIPAWKPRGASEMKARKGDRAKLSRTQAIFVSKEIQPSVFRHGAEVMCVTWLQTSKGVSNTSLPFSPRESCLESLSYHLSAVQMQCAKCVHVDPHSETKTWSALSPEGSCAQSLFSFQQKGGIN